jgi:hypothetical protein
MNLVGKIFVFIILVMSVVFMAFAVAVYATHKNWRDVVLNPTAGVGRDLGLKLQLDEEKKRNEDLTKQLEDRKKELETEKAARRQSLTKLQEEATGLKKERDDLETQVAALKKDQRQVLGDMAATQASASKWRTELDAIRTDIRGAQKDRDDNFKQVVILSDNLQQAQGELNRLKDRQVQLAEQIAQAKKVLAASGLDINVPVGNTPPEVQGIVVAAKEGGMVEISIGSDDGLRQGNTLDVFRSEGPTGKYLGRIEVLETKPDRSVAKVLPEFRKGIIQKEDRVSTKLR